MLNTVFVCGLFAAIGPLLGADARACARCHQTEVDNYLSSPMGRSIAAAPNLPGLAAGQIFDERAKTSMSAARRGSQMIHTLSRGALSADYEISYAVGADVVGYTFLVQHGAYIFQSPLSWYREKNGWDVTPTYQTDTTIDLDRPAVSACLFCHAGSVRLLPGASNRFEQGSLTAISCERCHGPVERHLSSPVSGSIVNPAKLSGAQRDNVCEQCHLEGEVRILNPGRDWWDFHAGQKLEDVFVTFVRSRSERGTKAVSQVEQLADSRCARESGGRLWCASCHDPHGQRASASSVRRVCMSCHESLFSANRHQPAEDCISCHMPKLRAENVAHAAVTDHTIPRLPGAPLAAPQQAPYVVRAWREPGESVRDRDIGLALLRTGASRHDAAIMKAGYDLLAAYYRTRGSRDAEVVSALASVVLDMNDTGLAASLFRTASSLQPASAESLYGLASALAKGGHPVDAIPELRRAIAADPSYRNAYLMLADIYRREGETAMQTSVIEEYLRFMPGSIRFRLLLPAGGANPFLSP